MLIEEELARVVPGRDTALTIGVFDGVHSGHRFLISKLHEKAAADGLASAVVTFKHHPRQVLPPQSPITYLTSLEERVRLLSSLGVEHVVALSFTSELARLSAREFVSALKRHMRMRALVVGPDFALGRGRGGDADTLAALGQELGFSVTKVAPQAFEGQVVSSTAIREALSRGEVQKANRLLGRNFALQGEVSRGDARGAELGFPTANLVPQEWQALPSDGVYAARASVGGKGYGAVVNIGVRPTFDGEQRLIEAHLLGFEGMIYGQGLKLELVDRLRDEIRFESAEELKAQMARDVEQASAMLERP